MFLGSTYSMPAEENSASNWVTLFKSSGKHEKCKSILLNNE
jgi:hypothetical protein